MITIGALSSPLPFILVGFILGALLMLTCCLWIADRTVERRDHSRRHALIAERRAATALRNVIAACDRGDDLRQVRRIASAALYPSALDLDDDTPIIPEANHG